MLSKIDFLKFLSFIFFLFPSFACAEVSVTEIMYDLEGSDSGREWVEVTNTGSNPVDLSEWKFYENDTNHGLTLYQGNSSLDAGESAIISDDPAKFLSDWPSFSGVIFDSSFSLKNTGESLSIRNEELVDIDSVDYIPDWGGEGDGNSLQKINGSWSAGNPNPGEYNFGEESQEEQQSNTEENSGGTFSPMIDFPVGNISTRIIAESVVLAGADTEFRTESFGVEGGKLENARHLWNFGDGKVIEGQKVLHNYIYPGEYIIFLDVNSEDFTASDKFYIKVVPSSLVISEATNDFIKIRNDSEREINISFWLLQAGVDFFTFSKNTYIRPNGEIVFSREVTGLNGLSRPLNLLYPNGNIAYEFGKNISKVSSAGEKKEVQRSSVQKNIYIAPTENVRQSHVATAVLDDVRAETEEITKSESSNFFNKWLLGILGIIVLGAFSILFVKADSTVEGYRIIE